MITAIIITLHHIDFAFLRDKPEFMTFGFTIAVIEMILLAIFSTSSVLEKVSKEKAIVSAEIDIAKKIQTEILPEFPTVENIEISGVTVPSNEVGGDFYEFKTIKDQLWFFYGDVTGHGLGAGLGMVMIQSIINSVLNLKEAISPRLANFEINKQLFDSFNRLSFEMNSSITTVVFGEKKLILSGKHCPILVFRYETKEVEEISVNQIPFGLGFSAQFPEEKFKEIEVPLYKNDVVFFATDGVYEAAKEGIHKNGLLDKNIVKQMLVDHHHDSCKEISQGVFDYVQSFTDGVLHDDLTIIVAKVM